ncbi:MAG: response regulator [Ilumatobacteraceae bacterium]|nr:response regulator [Ilumatobacteraceae bacterium]
MPRNFEPFFTTKPPGQGEHAVAATVLVVEDEPTVSRLRQRVLERDGFQVRVAASGREVLDHWNLYEQSVDLVITDLVMPGGVSGRQLAAELRRLEPTLPIVFTSGYDPDLTPSNQTMMPGANFIPKPSSAEQILAVVRRQLATRLSLG